MNEWIVLPQKVRIAARATRALDKPKVARTGEPIGMGNRDERPCVARSLIDVITGKQEMKPKLGFSAVSDWRNRAADAPFSSTPDLSPNPTFGFADRHLSEYGVSRDLAVGGARSLRGWGQNPAYRGQD